MTCFDQQNEAEVTLFRSYRLFYSEHSLKLGHHADEALEVSWKGLCGWEPKLQADSPSWAPRQHPLRPPGEAALDLPAIAAPQATPWEAEEPSSQSSESWEIVSLLLF